MQYFLHQAKLRSVFDSTQTHSKSDIVCKLVGFFISRNGTCMSVCVCVCACVCACECEGAYIHSIYTYGNGNSDQDGTYMYMHVCMFAELLNFSMQHILEW